MKLSAAAIFRVHKIILASRLKYSVGSAEWFSFGLLVLGLLAFPLTRAKSASLLMRAHRNTRSLSRQKTLEWLLERFGLMSDKIVASLIPTSFRHERIYQGRVFQLKLPRPGERGVLLIKYSELFAKVRAGYDLDRILKDYFVVLEPSYSSYCSPEILGFREFANTRVVVQSPEIMDYAFIQRLNSNLVPIEIGSSNWVDDRVFVDLQQPKDYDCIMVALWGDIKRHHVLFSALKQINDPSYRACLVGGNWDRKRPQIEEIAEYYGVLHNCEFYERLSPSDVNRMLNRSKVNLLLTLKEGANKSIFEGFFANVPGIVLKENYGVNKKYLNESTGMLVPERDLAEALVWIRKEYTQFTPRKWALENIAPRISAQKLQAVLKGIALELGEPWTEGILTKVNRPECEYYDPEQKLPQFDFAAYARNRT